MEGIYFVATLTNLKKIRGVYIQMNTVIKCKKLKNFVFINFIHIRKIKVYIKFIIMIRKAFNKFN